MKRFLLAFLFLFLTGAAFAQNSANNPGDQPAIDLNRYGVKIQPDKRLIVVMTALEAAGINTTLTETGKAFRVRVRADFQNIDENLRQRMVNFLDGYKKKRQATNAQLTDAQLTAPFVSLAYALGPAPDLALTRKAEDLPSDVSEVLDFADLARQFYLSPGVDARITEYLKIYQTEGDKLRFSTALMAGSLLDYLHTRPELVAVERIKTEEKDPKTKKDGQKITTRTNERRFYVVPDLLAPDGAAYFQTLGDDYFVVVPPNTNLSLSEARRGYLHFVIDPLVFKNAKDIAGFRDGIRKLLDERRQNNRQISPDVFLAVSASLVAAADAREIEFQKVQIATAEARRRIDLAQGTEAKKSVSAELAAKKQTFADETALQLLNAYERGAVLSFYFAEQLKGAEDSGFDIASSMRDIILSLNPAQEATRSAQYADARQRALASREALRNRQLQMPTKLGEIENLVKQKKYDAAETQLKQLLDDNPNESRIYYNLGRLSSILAEPSNTFDQSLRDRRLDDARAYFSNAIKTADAKTDPALLQLAYVALGRIYEFYDQNETALKAYDAAIQIGNVSGGAYGEAVNAKNALAKKP